MATVRVETAPRVATVVLDRPEARNALSVEMCDELVAAFEDVAASAHARVVLLRGEGRVFCAGADFAAVSGASGLEFLPAFERMLEAVAAFPLPVVAAIHGAALGGGLQLATVCDFRIVADDARLGIPAARLGILVNLENVQRLVRLVGVARAKEVLMTAREYSGAGALAAGLVTRAVPAADLEREAASFADEIAALAPRAVQGAKRAIASIERSLSDIRCTDAGGAGEVDALVEAAYRSDDLQEGIAALNEHRPPRFGGR
ncbi:MAG: enoyl-CoA hydratase/isomerase family protein [Actinomycetota bacterium]|nr:enoyl-CoA hydratase/isomerase family protein [Actinomycetota bacterium]